MLYPCMSDLSHMVSILVEAEYGSSKAEVYDSELTWLPNQGCTCASRGLSGHFSLPMWPGG